MDYEYDPYEAMHENSIAGDTILGAYGWLVTLVYLGYFFFMMYKIAHRTGQADTAWWAFVPILNTLLLIQMAGKPWKWFWLLLIPFVNFITFFVLWINAARNCGQSGFWGFLVMFPIINIIPLFVLAMSSRPYVYPDFMDETLPPGPKQPAAYASASRLVMSWRSPVMVIAPRNPRLISVSIGISPGRFDHRLRI